MHHPIYAKTLFMHAFWGSTSLVPIRPHAFLFMHLHNYFEAKKRVRVPPYDFAFHPIRCHGSHSSSLFLVCLYVTSSPNDTRSVKKSVDQSATAHKNAKGLSKWYSCPCSGCFDIICSCNLDVKFRCIIIAYLYLCSRFGGPRKFCINRGFTVYSLEIHTWRYNN